MTVLAAGAGGLVAAVAGVAVALACRVAAGLPASPPPACGGGGELLALAGGLFPAAGGR